MTDDLDQLLKSLHLERLRETVERELQRATKQKLSYADFYARILREQEQMQRARSVEYRIRNAGLPERWSPTRWDTSTSDRSSRTSSSS